MPGTYTHWLTVQGDRDGEFVYANTSANLIIVDSPVDFTIEMDDYRFMIGETKELELRITNEGMAATDKVVFTVQLNTRFTYVLGSMTGGTARIEPNVERFEGGGIYVEFPSTLLVGAGETVAIRFQVTAN